MKKILIIIAVLVLAGLGYWAYRLWNAPAAIEVDFKPLTPEQRESLLGDLEKASAAPAAPVEQRVTEIQQLEAASAPVTDTRDERLERLKALEEASRH